MAETTTAPGEPGQVPAHRDLSEVPLAPPSANNGLMAVFQRRYLLRLLVRREINARYQGSFLGLLWSYINPLAQFFVYWAVIGGILQLHKQVENFPIHMFAGLVIVHFFTETFSAGTRSIVRNKSIVVKMPLPREMFPVATMLVSLYHVIPQIIILTLACLAYGWTPDPTGMAAMLIAIVMIMTIGTAVALVFSVANVFFRDFGNVVQVLLMFVRFGVPMIYPYSMVDDRFGELAKFYLLNPLADAVLLFQRAFWVGTTSDPEHTIQTDLPPNLLLIGLAACVAGMVMLVIAQVVFSRLENKIPERL
ncbi:ABC transporter [Nocardioides sp. GY 10113]|uniref:ABC transporter permease n=1 Tax=Nocardioides sp. GY 10113 TaxID=2569761 RepID=UPI0010A84715|nr:ABC transporter permease [Nocardioides sp. GY 10113]TIC87899.1 ABC transporter [Nocardioides sp. GY 10113]